MKKSARVLVLLLAMLMLLTACSSAPSAEKQEAAPTEAAFEPKLDTQKAVSLDVAVFFGNFEAFDQVINHFNDFYPNVTISYDTLNSSTPDFFANNPSIDIFMVSAEQGYPTESCLDLLEAGVDTGAVADGLLDSYTVDGKLLAVPMGLTLKGMVVNKTLLKNEGLNEPQTWQEFLDVLEALKQKGYTPIQGPSSAMGNLCRDMGMVMLSEDAELLKAVENGDMDGASALLPVYERLQLLVDKGYISAEVNAEYPEDNYDGAILRFFEGEVPFWVCDTEKVSGMKKRESKSEAVSANPFEYEFTFVPMGDSGVYEYIEPWYGFSVNKDSDALDYAAEFLRFLAREDELNTLASVKGVPSVTRNAPDSRYTNLAGIEKVAGSAVYDGSYFSCLSVFFANEGSDLAGGLTADANAALEKFVTHYAEVVAEG